MAALTENIKESVLNDIAKGFEEITPKEYAFMKYPRLIPMMKFETHIFKIDGFGKLFLMDTKAMGGAMKLLTLSLTPCEGGDIPYLLIDSMSMKNKDLAYVEYYDCTGKKLSFEELDTVKEKYLSLPDYAEKEAWYISERMPASLIKGGEGADAEALFNMALESLRTYLALAKKTPKDPRNLEGLKAFRDRMLTEGNPSSGTMEKVLGKDGSAKFYKECIMPVE